MNGGRDGGWVGSESIAVKHLRVAAILAVFQAGACGADVRGPAVVRTDSAGVTINTLASLPALDDPDFQWNVTVARSIALDRGAFEEPVLFRPQTMLRLSDGTIVVGDNAPDWQIAVIDPRLDSVTARFVRPGSGPGEIDGWAHLWPAGRGAIRVLDTGNGRISRYALDGRLESELATPDLGHAYQVKPRRRPLAAFALWWYHSDDPARYLIDSLAVIDPATGRHHAILPIWRAPNRADGTPVSGFVTFAPRTLYVPLAVGLITGRSDQGVFRHYSDDGTLLAEIRLPLTRRPVTDEDVERIRREIASSPEMRAIPLRNVHTHFHITNELYPIDDSTFAMHQGRETRGAEDVELPPGRTVWRLISVRGDYRGTIWLPKGFRSLWSGDRRLLGIAEDSTGAEHLQELSLEPPARLRAR
jgi:hypothetical protein